MSIADWYDIIYEKEYEKMTHRATITLDQEAYAFLLSTAQNNRSAFINKLLKKEKLRQLKQDIQKANQEEANDIIYQKELCEWDETLADGL